MSILTQILQINESPGVMQFGLSLGELRDSLVDDPVNQLQTASEAILYIDR